MFGVVPTDIEPLIHGVVISADSVPSTSTVEDWITTESLVVAGIYQSKGIDPESLATDTAGYGYGRSAVTLQVASLVMLAVQGRWDQAEALQAQADKMIERLKDWSGRLGTSARSDEGAVDTPSYSMSETLQARIDARPASLRTRMVRSRKM